MMLAATTYADVPVLQDRDGWLNLAWTLDEQSFLPVDFHQQLGASLAAALADDGRFVDRFMVKDPYGGGLLGPAVARQFGIAPDHCAVSCGAGVNALLHALARCALRGIAYIIGNVYPDFPHWFEQSGGRCVSNHAVDADGHAVHILRTGADVVLLERPAMSGDTASVEAVRALCQALAGTDVLVVIDESNANYCPVGFSAAPLVTEAGNLVVLRGLSKAFHLGGLRLGYVICCPALATRVRSMLVPLQVSSLSLQLGRAAIDGDDRCAALRERIRVAKARMAALLGQSTCPRAWRVADFAPYFFFPADVPTRHWIDAHGILGKLQPFWIGARHAIGHEYRVSVPLSEERMALCARKLAAT
jgi:histidinol-phosphate/aromatic aminotransferase/cobyric acid decarboxylase-like protein